jgi:hypothetical protein
MQRPLKLLVAGLPGAGKTTFIAALWHVTSSEEVKGSLVIDTLQPARDHLNQIAKLWRECETLPRTTLAKERTVTLNLRDEESGAVYEVTLPDSSGEAFRRAFELRRWSSSLEALAKDADSMLFFIHPESLEKPARLDGNVEEMVDILEPHEAESADVTPPVAIPWKPALASTASKIVDLIQFVLRARGGSRLRICFVISAWDLVRKEGLNPRAWIGNRAPLLSQFLDANNVMIDYAVFGVSAQGGDLKQADALREYIRPSERIEVVTDGTTSNDITQPLRWALVATELTR